MAKPTYEELVRLTHELIEGLLWFPVNTPEPVWSSVIDDEGRVTHMPLEPKSAAQALRLKGLIEDAELALQDEEAEEQS